MSRTSPTISGSRADVGSSKSITFGFIARALAIAILCFCPPDKDFGKASALSGSPTLASSSLAFSSALAFSIFFTSVGARVMLSKMFKLLKRLKDWNTIPISSRTLFMSIFFEVISSLSTKILPLVGLSKRFKHLKKVDLPEPDGPITTTTSPSFISWFIPFRTSSSPKDFVRFSTLIICKSPFQTSHCL